MKFLTSNILVEFDLNSIEIDARKKFEHSSNFLNLTVEHTPKLIFQN